MLAPAGSVPNNSQTPHPEAYWYAQGTRDLYSVFAAGLTAKGASNCIPGPAAFADLAPAGDIIPLTNVNIDQPALSTAYLGPSPVPALSAQVAQTQQSMQQMVANRSNILIPVLNAAGQQGPQQDDFSDAAQVVPIGTTENMIAEQNPGSGILSNGVTARPQRFARTRHPGNSRRSYDVAQDPKFPGVPWGGASVQGNPNGGCNPSSGLSMWQLLFLLAGLGVITVAVIDQ